jgi:holin-like protein
MLGYLTLIFGCQLAGELIVAATALPVPGPVCGMVLLFAGLVVRGGVPAGLARVGDGLLGHLSLMFVPAGVGIMMHAGLIAREWLPIVIALILSAVLTIVLTAGLMLWLGHRLSGAGERQGPEGR